MTEHPPWRCDLCGSKDVMPFEIKATRKKHVGGGHFEARMCKEHYDLWAKTNISRHPQVEMESIL